jgi:hypothetical protein
MTKDDKFFDRLLVEFDGDEENWVILEDFKYSHEGEIIIVPKGFTTDFASIPRVFRNILSPYGEYGKAAVIHDFLYQNQGWNDRRRCDDVLLQGMIDLGVGWIKRNTIYSAVRTFGWYVWNKHNKDYV